MIELTIDQIKTLEDTFNWALEGLKDAAESSMMFTENENGEFEAVDFKAKERKIEQLFRVMQKNIRKKSGANERGISTAFVIKAKNGPDTLYYKEDEGIWTTIIYCTKYYMKSRAEKVKDSIKSDFWHDISVVKSRTEEV